MFTGLIFTIPTDQERQFLDIGIKNAVVYQQVDQKAYSCNSIIGRCIVMNEHDFATRRQTEIAEKDVYVCTARKIDGNRYEVAKTHPFLNGILDYELESLQHDQADNALLPEVMALNYRTDLEQATAAEVGLADGTSSFSMDTIKDGDLHASNMKSKMILMDDDLRCLMELDEVSTSTSTSATNGSPGPSNSNSPRTSLCVTQSMKTTVNNNEIDEPTVKRICLGLTTTALDLYKECNLKIYGIDLASEWAHIEAKDKQYWDAMASKYNYAKLVRQYPQSSVRRVTKNGELGAFSVFAVLQSSYFPNIYQEATTLVNVWNRMETKEKEYYKIDLNEGETRNLERLMAISVVSQPPDLEPTRNLPQLLVNFTGSVPVVCGVYVFRWSGQHVQFESADDLRQHCQQAIFTGKTEGGLLQCRWDGCTSTADKQFRLEELRNHVNEAHLSNPEFKYVRLQETNR